MQAPFNLTILGSSAAVPTAEKFPTAQVLNALGRLFLIDCGEGTQHQLRVNSISPNRIDHILISHLHGDHFFGLTGLLSTMSLLGRSKDLHIYAHSTIKDYLDFQFAFLGQEQLGFNIIYHPLNFKSQQVIFKNKKLEICSFPLKHSIPTCGFRFDELAKEANIKKDYIKLHNIPLSKIKDIKQGSDFVTAEGKHIPNELLVTPPPPARSYAYCSDTMYYPNIIAYIKNVSLLYHESTFLEKDKIIAERTMHSTAKEAATIAKDAEVGKLIVGHFSARYKSSKVLLAEAKETFKSTDEAIENRHYKITG